MCVYVGALLYGFHVNYKHNIVHTNVNNVDQVELGEDEVELGEVNMYLEVL